MNSLVARRMVKKQQMQWSKRGAHLCFRFGPPFSTAIFASASRTSRRNKPIIEDRVAVRADTAAAQDGLTPQLIYRSLRCMEESKARPEGYAFTGTCIQTDGDDGSS